MKEAQVTPFLQARLPVHATGTGPSTPHEEPARPCEERGSAPLPRLDQLALADTTIAKLQRGAEVRACDRARRARAVETHARSIETLLRAMRDLAVRAFSTRFANADRRALDYVLATWRRQIDAIATRASVEGTPAWTRRAGDEDLAADAVFDTLSLGVAETHLRDVAGAIATFEATEQAIAIIAAVRGDLTMIFRALELEVDSVRAMRANLTAASGRLCDAEDRDALADEALRTMATPAYKA
jgi:hypothetical protein